MTDTIIKDSVIQVRVKKRTKTKVDTVGQIDVWSS